MPNFPFYDDDDEDFDEEDENLEFEIKQFLNSTMNKPAPWAPIKAESNFEEDKITIYLAGPIEQDLELESTETPHSIIWRDKLTSYLENDPVNVWDVRNPTRGKVIDGRYQKVAENSHCFNPGILFRTDLSDVDDSAFLVVNITQAAQGSIGTMFELGYAYAKDIPVICIGRSEHPFLTESVEIFVENEMEAYHALLLLIKS